MDIQELANAMDPRPEQVFEELSQDDPDGLYDKYRVFKEPQDDESNGHPVPLYGPYQIPPSINPNNYIEGEALSIGFRSPLEEVTDFVFVLKPDSDPHARVALAAYAQSVRYEKPQLYDDLWEILKDV